MKSRHCPQCNWKFPIAKVNAPIPRINGKMFNCPSCQLPLVYRTNYGKLYSVCSALIIPSAIFFSVFKDDPIIRDFALYLLLPMFIVISVVWRRGEYIEQFDPP